MKIFDEISNLLNFKTKFQMLIEVSSMKITNNIQFKISLILKSLKYFVF